MGCFGRDLTAVLCNYVRGDTKRSVARRILIRLETRNRKRTMLATNFSIVAPKKKKVGYR